MLLASLLKDNVYAGCWLSLGVLVKGVRDSPLLKK